MRLLLVTLGVGCLGAADPLDTFRLAPTEAASAEQIVEIFLSDVEAAGYVLPSHPVVWVDSQVEPIGAAAWRPERRAIKVPDPAALPPGAVALFERWLGPERGGRLLRIGLYGFFVTHGLAHFLQEAYGIQRASLAEAEREANEIAAAWWAGRAGGHQALRAFARLASEAIAKAPSPVPAEADLGRWFDTHFDEIARDPAVYSWFRLRFAIDAIEGPHRLAWAPRLSAVLREGGRVPVVVELDAFRDVGFHLAAHLPGTPTYDPAYVSWVAAIDGAGVPPIGPALVKDLAARGWLLGLLRLPMRFDSGEAARAALRHVVAGTALPRALRQRLGVFLDAYPALRAISGEDRGVALRLVEAMERAYGTFYERWHRTSRPAWEVIGWGIRDRLARLAPRMARLAGASVVRQAVIVLSPALRGRAERVQGRDGVVWVAAELPLQPDRIEPALLLVLRELTGAFSDPRVHRALGTGARAPADPLRPYLRDAAESTLYRVLAAADPPLARALLQRGCAGRGTGLLAHVRGARPSADPAQVEALQAALRQDHEAGCRRLLESGLLVPEPAWRVLRSLASP